MKAVRTEKSNFIYYGPIEGIGDLDCQIIPDSEWGRVVRSIWIPTDEERQYIADGGNIELDILTPEQIPPVSVNVTDEIPLLVSSDGKFTGLIEKLEGSSKHNE